ncbi:hypothetical protein NL676_011180 [Syzygium grande]|nr:hypothetical protein NL676_011180 [Syzygium grande]
MRFRWCPISPFVSIEPKKLYIHPKKEEGGKKTTERDVVGERGLRGWGFRRRYGTGKTVTEARVRREAADARVGGCEGGVAGLVTTAPKMQTKFGLWVGKWDLICS